MDRKLGPLVDVKIGDENKGEVKAVFSTLNVVDKDKDVTLPGAFGEQNVRISAYNHQSWQGELPVGKGTINEHGDEAILNGRFFMDVPKARDTFLTIKNLGGLMEWSYGYDILERSQGKFPEGDEKGEDVQFLKKLKVHEVSPVILGAGENTRTIGAKGSKAALSASQVTAALAATRRIMAALNADTPPQAQAIFDLIDTLQNAVGDSQTSDLDFEGGIKLSEHLVWVTSEVVTVSDRVIDLIKLRQEKGENISDEAMSLVNELLDNEKRLREAVAIEPRKANPNDQLLLEQIFRNSRALLFSAGGSE
jgi:hypothetical protein